LINNCTDKKTSLQLIHSTEINFPSASAIEFYNNSLYVFGDDARNILVLSPAYSIIDSVAIADPGSYRISKEGKHDIESAMIVIDNGKPHLFGVGSMSTNKRWNVIGYDLKAGAVYHTHFFDFTRHFTGIEQINIEGSCVVDSFIIFSNRANLSHSDNHLLFWNRHDSISVTILRLPMTGKIAGVSGLYYIKEKDMLLFTASEEETVNAVDDGEIGESYLGWIENFSKKINQAELKTDRFLKLSEVDAAFSKQKIESVCVEKINSDEMIIHLVADNDNGKSKLFKMKLFL
jgi:hypothetical protein